jgi:hypothetical protein
MQTLRPGNQGDYEAIIMANPESLMVFRISDWAGAPDFRDFSGLLAVKENRNGSRQTLSSLLPAPDLCTA